PFRIVPRADGDRLPRLEEARRRGRLEFRIDDDLERLPRRIDTAHVELRVVVPHRAEAGQDRAGARPPAMPVCASRFAGDPLALAVRERGAAVEARGNLHAYPGPAAGHPRDESDVEFARFVFF